jgi:hypothetical protein
VRTPLMIPFDRSTSSSQPRMFFVHRRPSHSLVLD